MMLMPEFLIAIEFQCGSQCLGYGTLFDLNTFNTFLLRNKNKTEL